MSATPSPTGSSPVTVKAVAVKVIDSPDSATTRTVRNAGASVVTLSRDSGLAAGAGFTLATTKEVPVSFQPGESLWAICAGGQETTLEVL